MPGTDLRSVPPHRRFALIAAVAALVPLSGATDGVGVATADTASTPAESTASVLGPTQVTLAPLATAAATPTAVAHRMSWRVLGD